jgi:Bacterial lipid A biosynthesis acyltransferase
MARMHLFLNISLITIHELLSDMSLSDSNDDDHIFTLRKYLSDTDQLRKNASALALNYSPLADRAYILYSIASDRLGIAKMAKEKFCAEHITAWADFLRSAAESIQPSQILIDPIEKKHIYVLWHFPEYPKLTRLVIEKEAYALVARSGGWLDAVIGSHKQVNFRSNGLQKLHRVFTRGESIFTMLDYCYQGTRSIQSRFLGFTASTPVGLFSLALKFGYKVKIIQWNGDAASLLSVDSAIIENNQACADYLNNIIEKSIMQAAPRWLLWPSIDQRWDYWQ